MELVRKARKLAEPQRRRTHETEIEILERCDGQSGQDEVKVQQCLLAATTLDAMEACLEAADASGAR